MDSGGGQVGEWPLTMPPLPYAMIAHA